MGLPSATPRVIMKNFARLVRFALPYQVRFGLSIACAAMVALLFFTELGAVYPLLHILFNRPEPPAMGLEKIDSIERADHRSSRRRSDEMGRMLHAVEVGDLQAPELAGALSRPRRRARPGRACRCRDREHLVQLPDLRGSTAQAVQQGHAELESLKTPTST